MEEVLNAPIACWHCRACSDPAGVPFKRCARCRVARYCSPQCQRLDWPSHKEACAAHAAELGTMLLAHGPLGLKIWRASRRWCRLPSIAGALTVLAHKMLPGDMHHSHVVVLTIEFHEQQDPQFKIVRGTVLPVPALEDEGGQAVDLRQAMAERASDYSNYEQVAVLAQYQTGPGRLLITSLVLPASAEERAALFCRGPAAVPQELLTPQLERLAAFQTARLLDCSDMIDVVNAGGLSCMHSMAL